MPDPYRDALFSGIAELMHSGTELLRGGGYGMLARLDCHDQSAAWARRVEEVASRVAAAGHPGAARLPLLQIDLCRTDPRTPGAGGEHVALRVEAGGRFLIIDPTHNQFDVPNRTGLRDAGEFLRRPAVAAAINRFLVRLLFGGTAAAVESEWMAFIDAKPYVVTGSVGNLRHWPASHRFD